MVHPVRRRGLELYAALAVLMLAFPGSAGPDDAGEAAYLKIRDEVASFRKDEKRRQFRHHYEQLATRMRRFAAESPSSERADDALYVAAQLTEELYRASRVGRDLEAAVTAYEEMAKRYPDSNLADDALFTAARIRLEEQGDRAGARRDLELVVAMTAPADFRPRARELLSRLPAAEAAPPEGAGEGEAARGEASATRVTDLVHQVAADLEQAELDEGAGGAEATGGEADEGSATAVAPVEALPDPPPEGTKPQKLTRIRHTRSKDESVVRVRLPGPVGVERGEAPATDNKPRRVFYDLTPAKLVGKVAPVSPKDGVVERVRAGQYDDDTVRLVVELTGQVEPVLHIERDPFELRLIVDRRPKAASAPAPVAQAAPAAPAPTGPASPAAKPGAVAAAAEHAEPPPPAVIKERLGDDGAPGGVSFSQQMGLKVRRIVIDAGHGGHDTGAVGPSGVVEKDVNLKIAKAIRAKLKERLPQIEVIMTRDDDTFIELAERTRIANDAGADLFISIHANANPSRRVHGVETYYLNITHDRYAIRLAARENSEAGDGASISDLEFILADLAMKSNVDDSIRLGRHVQSSVVGKLRTKYDKVNDLGLKHALFFVLLGSRMPAILVETSFLSNRMEEKRLASSNYRDAVADGVVKGILRFMEERQAMNLQ